MSDSPAEASLVEWLDALGYSGWSREYRFSPPRQWRFDFAWPSCRFAVEVEGVSRKATRHQRMQGFVADCEKYERALQLGWQVYRVPSIWLYNRRRRVWRREVMETIEAALDRLGFDGASSGHGKVG